MKIRFGIDNIPIENNRLPNIYWMPKMHKNFIKARFIIASTKSSKKPLARTITSIFRLFFRQLQTYYDKCRLFTGINTFWVVQNNKRVTDAMNGLINKGKQLLFHPLIFLLCILNCHIINFSWYLIVWLISVLMEEKVYILQSKIMELTGQKVSKIM